jgi:ABC-type nitrate/sulfonate/bicarbonate transport system substrate-binding protein
MTSRNMKLHAHQLSIVVGILILGSFGCNRTNLSTDKSSTASTPVRVAYAPLVIGLPLFVAQDQKLFSKNGVEVELKPFITANDMINSVVAGQEDAVVGVSLVPILNLEAQYPGTVRIIQHSRVSEQHPLDGLIVKTAASINNLDDLKGRKIAVLPGTTATHAMQAFLKQKGIAPESVQFIQLPPSSQLSALESGSVDALLAYEPTLTIALRQGDFRQLYGSIYAALQSPSPISASIISRDFERKHPEEAKRFINALDEAVKSIRSDKTTALYSLTNFTKVPANIVTNVNTLDDTSSSEVDQECLRHFISLMEKIGEIPPGKVDGNALTAPTK